MAGAFVPVQDKITGPTVPVTLGVTERICLLNILPKEGTVENLRLVARLRRQLELTDEEIEAIGLKQTILPDGRPFAQWDSEAAVEVEFQLEPRAYVLVQNTLRALDVAGTMRAEFLPLWDIFFPAAE